LGDIKKIVLEILALILNKTIKDLALEDVYYRMDIKIINLTVIKEKLQKHFSFDISKLNIQPTDSIEDTIVDIYKIKNNKIKRFKKQRI